MEAPVLKVEMDTTKCQELINEAKKVFEKQPIGTAPKDGTKILACDAFGWYVVFWDENANWRYPKKENWADWSLFGEDDTSEYGPSVKSNATHWMPLPELPTA